VGAMSRTTAVTACSGGTLEVGCPQSPYSLDENGIKQ
jgi:hypothetical protein